MRTRKVTKVLVMLLALVMLFSACTNGQPSKQTNESKKAASSDTSKQDNKDDATAETSNVNPAGEYPIVKEKITLEFMMPQQSDVKDMETNALTLYMEELTNIHIDWKLIASKEQTQKINLTLASNTDLPDVFYGCKISDSTLITYGKQGVFLPLNDYLDEYGEYFNIMCETAAASGVKEAITSPDGNIYSLPRVSESYPNEWAQRMFVNMSWLEALDMKVPTTIDDLYNMLVAFKNDDPNGNGIKDEIPLVGSTTTWKGGVDGFLMCMFTRNGVNRKSTDRLTIENGKISANFIKDEYREGLKWINKICEEGLLDPVTFTQDNSQLKQLVANSDHETVGAVLAGSYGFVDPSGDRAPHYDVIGPVEGPDGYISTPRFPNYPANGYYVITNSCEDPLAAFRWGDYMLSEDALMRNRFGVPGTDWVEPAEDELGMDGNPGVVKLILQWDETQNSHWSYTGPAFRTNRVVLGQVFDKSKFSTVQPLYDAAVKYYDKHGPDEVIPPITMGEEDGAEFSALYADISSYVEENVARFITGDRDIDAEWDDYVSELDALGLARFLELMQTNYDRQYGK